jgi:hypothetical protein
VATMRPARRSIQVAESEAILAAAG